MSDHDRKAPTRPSAQGRPLWLASCVFVALGTAACDSDLPGAADAIERATFVQTYVELRMSGLDTDSQRIADPARDSILTHNGVTADDLLHFASVYSRDPEFMRDVWADIEAALNQNPRSEN